MTFILETTCRETGETERQEFAGPEERIAAFARLDVHSQAYRFIETDEDAP